MSEEEIKQHPADVADQLERLPVEEAQETLRELPNEERAAVLAEMEKDTWPAFLEGLSALEIVGLVGELPHDEAADVLASVSPERKGDVLNLLPRNERDQIAQLMRYEPDTAGGIMTDRFIALREEMTILEAQQLLRGKAEEVEGNYIAYLYVTNSESKLTGIISIHDLVFRGPDRRIREIMQLDVKHVWADDDQEKIAQLFDHYHYMALPVLERDGRLVGIVQASQVIDILRQEATEDMQLMVGLSGEERALTPWPTSMKRRLPWLCVNLGTAFLAAAVVGMFEETIASWTALAVLLPVVAGQGGNAGAQTLTVIIRDMALGEISEGDGRKALFKEVLLGVGNGLVIGLIVGLCSYFWKGDISLGVVVAIAMLLNMVAAGISGVMVPYTLKAFRIDPALASSIMVTTVTDVAGFFFFLGLATLVR